MKIKILITLSLLISFFSYSKDVNYSNGKTLAIEFSILNPNYIEIDGDVITKIVSLDNKVLASGTTGGGSIVIINDTYPFTFLIETEKGLIIPVESVSTDKSGSYIKIIPDEITKGKEIKKWEKGGNYENILVNIAKGILNKSTDFESQKATSKNTPKLIIDNIKVSNKSIYQGFNHYIVQYELENNSDLNKNLNESMIDIKGLRAVFFDSNNLTLKPKEKINIYLVLNME